MPSRPRHIDCQFVARYLGYVPAAYKMSDYDKPVNVLKNWDTFLNDDHVQGKEYSLFRTYPSLEILLLNFIKKRAIIEVRR